MGNQRWEAIIKWVFERQIQEVTLTVSSAKLSNEAAVVGNSVSRKDTLDIVCSIQNIIESGVEKIFSHNSTWNSFY